MQREIRAKECMALFPSPPPFSSWKEGEREGEGRAHAAYYTHKKHIQPTLAAQQRDRRTAGSPVYAQNIYTHKQINREHAMITDLFSAIIPQNMYTNPYTPSITRENDGVIRKCLQGEAFTTSQREIRAKECMALFPSPPPFSSWKEGEREGEGRAHAAYYTHKKHIQPTLAAQQRDRRTAGSPVYAQNIYTHKQINREHAMITDLFSAIIPQNMYTNPYTPSITRENDGVIRKCLQGEAFTSKQNSRRRHHQKLHRHM